MRRALARAGAAAAALYVLHWAVKGLLLLGLAAAAYFSTGCAVLRCEEPSCFWTREQLERRREMTERRDAHRNRMLSIRMAEDYRGRDRRRR